MIERLYRYEARDLMDRTVDGQLIAVSREDAEVQLRQLSLRALALDLDVQGTLSLLVAGRDFDLRELARLYASLGGRLTRGGNLATGLQDVAEFVIDVRLRAALSVWIAAYRGGAKTSESMRIAGLPARHVAAVAALEESGSLARALKGLATECLRDYEIRAALGKLVRQPALYGLVALIAYWGALAFLVPPVMQQIGRLGTRGLEVQPPYVQVVAALGSWAHDHLLLWTLACAGVALGVVAFARSQQGRRCADLLPMWRRLSERADMAQLWGAFAVLYGAGERLQDAAHHIADAARRPASQEWFLALAASLRAGYRLDEAVVRAGFPRYVASAVGQAVAQQGGVDESLERFADERAADVFDLLDRLTGRVDLLLKLGLGLLILGLAAVTYLPVFIAAGHMR